MVEFKVYEDKKKKKDKTIYLKLEEGYGKVNLSAVDEDGDEIDAPHILAITNKGKLQRYPAVNEDYFEVDEDEDGCIEIDE